MPSNQQKPKANPGKDANTNQWWNDLTGSNPNEPYRVRIEEGKRWFEMIPNLQVELSSEPLTYKINRDNLEKTLTNVPKSYEIEVQNYQKFRNANMSSSDQKWINDVIKSGTLSDKVAALTMLIQESPFHELKSLDQLINLIGYQPSTNNSKHHNTSNINPRTAEIVLEALKDLLLHNLLPNDRRLLNFSKRPLGHPSMNMPIAMIFYYESELASRASKIVDILEASLRSSTLEHHKKNCINMVYEWLVSKPEQEARLLAILVNKLGDPHASISQKAMDCLKQLVKRHPVMKLLVVKEVKRLMSIPGIASKTIFTCLVYLTQIPLVASISDIHHNNNSSSSNTNGSNDQSTAASKKKHLTKRQKTRQEAAANNLVESDYLVANELIDCYIGIFENIINNNTNTSSDDNNSKDNKSHKDTHNNNNKNNKNKNGANEKGKGKNSSNNNDKTTTADTSVDNNRVLPILLNGINKAYPCVYNHQQRNADSGKNSTTTTTNDGATASKTVTGSSNNLKTLDKHLDTLYKLIHTTGFSTATQALVLLSQCVFFNQQQQTNNIASNTTTVVADPHVDRFYSALYAHLQSEQVIIVTCIYLLIIYMIYTWTLVSHQFTNIYVLYL